MTIKVRNAIFISGLTAMGLVFLLFLIGSILMFIFFIPKISPENDVNSPFPYFNLVYILILLIYCLGAGILLRVSFRKTSSAEIFFFFLFLVFTSFDALRTLILLADLRNLPFEAAVTISRTIYFFRFLGTLCLFTSGLFACGIQYQRMEVILGISTLIALSLATTIPLDTAVRSQNLLLGNSLGTEFLIGFLIVKLLGIGNYFYAGTINNNRSYYFMALGIGLVFAGQEILFLQSALQLPPLLALMAFVLLFSGTLIFGKRTHEVYLWF